MDLPPAWTKHLGEKLWKSLGLLPVNSSISRGSRTPLEIPGRGAGELPGTDLPPKWTTFFVQLSSKSLGLLPGNSLLSRKKNAPGAAWEEARGDAGHGPVSSMDITLQGTAWKSYTSSIQDFSRLPGRTKYSQASWEESQQGAEHGPASRTDTVPRGVTSRVGSSPGLLPGIREEPEHPWRRLGESWAAPGRAPHPHVKQIFQVAVVEGSAASAQETRPSPGEVKTLQSRPRGLPEGNGVSPCPDAHPAPVCLGNPEPPVLPHGPRAAGNSPPAPHALLVSGQHRLGLILIIS